MLTNWCSKIDVWSFRFDHFQGAFSNTCFLARGLALFQQFVDDAGSLDGTKQNLKFVQSVEDDSATGPLQKHQFELPVDCNDNVEMFPASPHDRDTCLRPGE